MYYCISILANFKSCLDMALAGYDNTSSGYYSLKLYDIQGIENVYFLKKYKRQTNLIKQLLKRKSKVLQALLVNNQYTLLCKT